MSDETGEHDVGSQKLITKPQSIMAQMDLTGGPGGGHPARWGPKRKSTGGGRREAMRLWNDRRLRLSLTGLGAQYLLALLGVGVFSVNTGNNLLYLVFALMLGLFLVSGMRANTR